MWKTATIGDVLSVIQNGINCTQDKSGKGLKITRIETIADANINFNKTGFSNLDDNQKQKAALNKGDILFSHINSPIHVGKTAIYDGSEPLYHGINLLRLRTIEDVDSKYFNFFLQSLFWSGYWRKTAKQSVNQASVNQTDIKKIPFAYPPLAEQERIVAKLDAAFAKIDETVELAQEAKTIASKIADASVKSALANNYFEWQTIDLGTIAENLDAKRVPITKSKRVEGDVPYYGASGIVDYVDGHLFNEELLLISEDGANLLMRTYPIAFSISGKTWVNNHAHVLRFSDRNTQKWVERYLNATDLTKFISGMAQPKLNQKKLNSIPIPLPNEKYMNDLLSVIDMTKQKGDELDKLQSEKVLQLVQLKSAILAQELQPPQIEAA